VSLYGGINSQSANKNLDSAEKFSLGGAQGVRGYPSGEGSGDEGMVAQLELRADLPLQTAGAMWQAFMFTDYGNVTVNRNNFVVGGLTPNSYSLKSWGLGLNVAKAGSFQVRTMWASKVGDNPGRNTITGNDADGKSARSRVWLQAVTQF
jgi:hemolysin activation/secretion protein